MLHLRKFVELKLVSYLRLISPGVVSDQPHRPDNLPDLFVVGGEFLLGPLFVLFDNIRNAI